MGIGVKGAISSYIAHFLAVAAVFLVLVWNLRFRGGLAWNSHNKNLIFNLHPVLMLIGVIIFGGEAIMINKSLPMKKPSKKLIHMILHLAALILGIIGIYAAFKFHNANKFPNFYSLHSWLGIGAISLYAIQWISGFLVFFFPGGSQALRSKCLPWHVPLGLSAFALAAVTSSLGFLEKLTFLEMGSAGVARFGSEAILVNITAIVTLLFGAFVILTTVSAS